jgi:adenosine deaminase
MSYHALNSKELRGAGLVKLVNMRDLPKVLLHEHLDGGLRPSTVVGLANEIGYDGLPRADAGEHTACAGG